MTDGDTRDRVIRLETSFENFREDFNEAKEQIKEVHDLLLQARGAKWAIFGMTTTLAGAAGFLSGWLSKLIPHHWNS